MPSSAASAAAPPRMSGAMSTPARRSAGGAFVRLATTAAACPSSDYALFRVLYQLQAANRPAFAVQGAFELLGSGRSGKIILILEMVGVFLRLLPAPLLPPFLLDAAGTTVDCKCCAGVALYVTWRFWEGITEQGSHPAYG